LSVVDRRLIERVTGAIGTQEALVEKDWQVIRTIKVIETVLASTHTIDFFWASRSSRIS
jgi:hypothetical protein